MNFFSLFCISLSFLIIHSVPSTCQFCKCVNDIMDCSRNRVFKSPNMCGDNVTRITFERCGLSRLPEALADTFTDINVFRCRLQTLPRIGANVEILKMRNNYIENLTDQLTESSSLKLLDLHSNRLQDLTFLPSPCGLEHLDVSANGILSLDGLQYCKELLWLDISRNPFSDEAWSFPFDFNKLLHLHITGPKIKFPAEFFLHLQNLLDLEIRMTNIREITKEDFMYLPQLQSLSLNRLYHLTSDSVDLFENLVELRKLKLIRCYDINLPKNVFSYLKNIKELDIYMCPMVLSGHIEEILSLPNLEKLNISLNKNWSLPENFPAKKTLKSLTFFHSVKKLTSEFFLGFTNLTYLDVHTTRYYSLESDGGGSVFSPLENLETLLLTSNRIERLPEGMLDSMPNLKEFGVNYNNLKELPPRLFSLNTKLEFIDLSLNRIKLSSDTFEGLSSLKDLRLRANRMQEIHEEMFFGLKSLKQLDLGANRIPEIKPQWFRDSKSLKTLDLADNEISHLPDGSFKGLDSLERLSLSGNNFITFPMHILADSPNLRILDLDKNSQLELPFFDVTTSPHLEKAYFGDCADHQMGNISEEAMRSWLKGGGVGRLHLHLGCLLSPKTFRWAVEDPDIIVQVFNDIHGALNTQDAEVTFSFDMLRRNWITVAMED